MSAANQKTVEAVYSAFGRGDVPFILERVTEGTRWDFSVGTSDVPWHGPFTSRADLSRFFQRWANTSRSRPSSRAPS